MCSCCHLGCHCLDRCMMQVITLNITFDAETFGMGGLSHLPLTCARRADGVWNGPWVFGRVCAARMDLESLPPDLPPHPWEFTLPPDLATSPLLQTAHHQEL